MRSPGTSWMLAFDSRTGRQMFGHGSREVPPPRRPLGASFTSMFLGDHASVDEVSRAFLGVAR